MITHPIYSYSLCIALPLMLFFGFYFIFALCRAIVGCQLFRTFLCRNPFPECGCSYLDESVYLFPLLLAFQFGAYYIA